MPSIMNRILHEHRVLAIVLASLAIGAPRRLSATDDLDGAPVDFNREIRPLLSEHCIACHGGVKRARRLSFIYREQALGRKKDVIVPGDPDASKLIERITAEEEDDRMPPADHGPRLSERAIELLRRWIREGAKWGEHWAYRRPTSVTIPPVTNPSWCRQPLDHFILDRIEKEGLAPSPPAAPEEWLRRVTFDLIGLPPTPEEVRGLLDDPSDAGFERAVDRLLGSPHFGERWAAMWMDLARYADSQGYEKDSLRTMWPYRDWLIRAFNADMPFDQLTVRQLAGDLLPDATLDDIIATAFHRNTPTNSEGGTDDEEFRVAAIIDRVNTTWEVWQGVTFKCVQCHSHPYDPIEHAEYYRFFAFLNTARDWDLRSDAPKLRVPHDVSRFAAARSIDRRLRELRRAEVEQTARVAAITDWRKLLPEHAASTGQTRLALKPGEGGVVEVHTEGTVSHDSRFTLDFSLPDGLKRLTALRVEVLPRDPDRARHTPELGFVISKLEAELIRVNDDQAATQASNTDPEIEGEADGRDDTAAATSAERVRFSFALGDEAEPFGDAQATLDEDEAGWGAKPRITHPRRLVLVTEGPVELSGFDRLRIVVYQDDAPKDLAPLVMDRSRYSASDSPEWSELISSDNFRSRREEIARLTDDRRKEKAVELPIMAEQERGLRRVTAIFTRGGWLDKKGDVVPGIPMLFGGLPTEEHTAGRAPDRLALARWLVSDVNPLTARVAANRFWEQLFGRGLVETLEDFGSSGMAPSHPRLLDFLALRFRGELGWSVKSLLREIVLSATYRQQARVTPLLRDRDPRNVLLARGPRGRLTAEMVRDNALAVSDLLSRKMFGPSVMPPQPDGIWRAARSKLKWKTATGEDRYRRALYTYWRRSSPYPSMMTFDAPNRLVCAARRLTTNTPLQALVTLNDPVYVECAVALARRMRAEGGSTVESRIRHGYRLAAGSDPSDADVEDLARLHELALATYRREPALAEKMAESPEAAALALVANAILNLDRVLTR